MRQSGILMHISSLPSKYGIGAMGKSAYEFVDFLKESRQSVWQVLPVNTTSYGDSPYQSFSIYAGNPYFIDLNLLCDEGLLDEKILADYDFGSNPRAVDYGKIYNSRFKVLKKAFDNFDKKGYPKYDEFINQNKFWLEDYALYMAVKKSFNDVCWLEWDEDIKSREPQAVKKYTEQFSSGIEFNKFLQFMFYEQWGKLRKYANDNGIKIIGDMPIYVAMDSADTWTNSHLFMLDDKKQPIKVAGCPPDAFSEDGQLWGNPIYRWDVHKKENYDWWVKRIEMASKIYDCVRIDHFRGFESYYTIPYGNKNARVGEWEKGPGYDLFKTVKQRLGDVDIIAEDLGFITDEVRKLLKDCGYPGMKILQHGFDSNGDSEHAVHNYKAECVAYTGTHDHNTLVGWIKDLASKSDLKYVGEYLRVKKKKKYPWAIISCLFGSVANLVIIPMQDLLELDNSARMNVPGTLGGNWTWRVGESQLNKKLANKLAKTTNTYRR